jgi:[ribosomal protein S5]-alanine N-acetyltransferase
MNILETKPAIAVRHVEINDHENIVDYFLDSDKDFLISLGVDISKLPTKQEWLDILKLNFELTIYQKKFFYIIWLANNKSVGHSNINKIIFAKEAYMHLHIWHNQIWQKGIGTQFLKLSLPYYFNLFKLENLYCEPAAVNNAPNKTLEKIGFEFVKTYNTIPGWINTYQTVNRWVLTKEKFKTL